MYNKHTACLRHGVCLSFKPFWLKCHYFLNFILAKFYLKKKNSKCIVLFCYMNDMSVNNLLYGWKSWDILNSIKWRITFKLSHIIKCLTILKRHMFFNIESSMRQLLYLIANPVPIRKILQIPYQLRGTNIRVKSREGHFADFAIWCKTVESSI